MVIKKAAAEKTLRTSEDFAGFAESLREEAGANAKLEAIVDEIEGVVHRLLARTDHHGNRRDDHASVKKLDKVAYVRFASVTWILRMCRNLMSS